MTLDGITIKLAKLLAEGDDSALATYINRQAEDITRRGEKLSDYYLVRTDGSFTYDGGDTVKASIVYGLVHASKMKKIEWPEDEL